MACQLDVDGVIWQASLTKPLRHLMTQCGARCPVRAQSYSATAHCFRCSTRVTSRGESARCLLACRLTNRLSISAVCLVPCRSTMALAEQGEGAGLWLGIKKVATSLDP